MVIKKINLDIVIGTSSKLPDTELAEYAFAGKSNVGKSSLINALMNRKSYARTSSKPGKTQTINFYNINDAFYLVDLPGYGFAQTSKAEQAKWGQMIERYLEKSRQLRQVFLLIDIRHEPGANDRQMYDWILSKGYEPVIIATKADKISRGQYQKQIKLIRSSLGAGAGTTIIPFSAQSKLGREEIYRYFEKTALAEGETDTRTDSSEMETDASAPSSELKSDTKAAFKAKPSDENL